MNVQPQESPPPAPGSPLPDTHNPLPSLPGPPEPASVLTQAPADPPPGAASRLTRLTSDYTLAAVNRAHIIEFFAKFKEDLAARNIKLPNDSMDVRSFDNYVAGLFASDRLPAPMYRALLAIEELSAPENEPLLLKALEEARIRSDPFRAPEDLALELWLRRPFDLAAIQSFKNRFPQPQPPPPAASSADDLLDQAASTPAAIAALPRNKIARLPADVVDSIHQMLYHHVPYHELLQRLGDYGKVLHKNNLTRFKKSPCHQAWLKNQQRCEDAAAQLQVFLDLARKTENGQIHEAIHQTAALRICEAFAQLDPAALTQTLQHDPEALVRLLQALPKLSQVGMDCERNRLEISELKSRLERQKNGQANPKRGISPATIKAFEEQLNLM